MVKVGEIRYMAPTITDRIHYFILSDPEDFWIVSDSMKSEEKVHCYKAKVNNATIALYHVASPKGDSAVGLIVPDKKTREKYFRVALVSFIACILWMVVVGLTLIGWIIASMLAVFGFSALLIIMEPIGPYILPIFWLTTILALIPIVVIMAYYPWYNRSLARRAISSLRDMMGKYMPASDFKETPVHRKFLSFSIRDRLPKDFQEEVKSASQVLGFIPDIDIVSYALGDEP